MYYTRFVIQIENVIWLKILQCFHKKTDHAKSWFGNIFQIKLRSVACENKKKPSIATHQILEYPSWFDILFSRTYCVIGMLSLFTLQRKFSKTAFSMLETKNVIFNGRLRNYSKPSYFSKHICLIQFEAKLTEYIRILWIKYIY